MGDTAIESLAGGFLITVCLAYMLFGMLIAQIYYYWLTYKDDHIVLRRYIWTLCVLAICHSVFSLIMIYEYFVTHFGDPEAGLDQIRWSARACIVVQIVFIIMTQSLYVHRIWQLSGKSVLATSIPALLVILRFVCGMANAVFLCVNTFWAGFAGEKRSRLSVNFTFVISVIADAVTSLILVYYLASKRGSVQRTTDIVNKLMVYTVHTGAITIVFALAVLFLFNFVKNSLTFAGVYILLGKMYANTMLAMLNARRVVLRPEGSDMYPIEFSRVSRPTETRIQIYSETVMATDDQISTPHTMSALSRHDLKTDPDKSQTYGIA